MAQRLNKKLVVGLTVAGMAAIAGAGVLLISALPGKDPKPSAEQAEVMAKQGEYEAASKYYLQAWRRARSANGDTEQSNGYLIKAGEMALAAGDGQAADKAWRQVLLNDPKNVSAMQKIVELMLEQAEMGGGGWWPYLQKEAEKLCEASGNSNVVGLHALGRALVEQTEKEENKQRGGECLLKAFELDKTNPEVARSLANFYLIESKGTDEGIQKTLDVYDTMLAAMEKNPPSDEAVLGKAWRYRGQLLLGIKQISQNQLRAQSRLSPAERQPIEARVATSEQDSLKSLQKALEVAPKDEDGLVALGSFYRAKEPEGANEAEKKADEEANTAKARSLFETAVKSDPDSFDAYLQLSDMHMARSEALLKSRDIDGARAAYEDAVKVLKTRIDRGNPRMDIHRMRNKAYMSLLRWQYFQLTSQQIERERQMLAPTQAAEQVKPLIERLRSMRQDFVADVDRGEKDPRALFMKARLQMLENDRYGAVETLEKLQELIGGGDLWVRAKLYLADLYAQIDQPGSATRSLRELLDKYPNIDTAWAMLAKSLIATPGQENAAEEAANRALALNSSNRDAIIVKMQILEKQGNYPEMERLQKLLLGDQESADNKVMRASLLLSKAKNVDNPEPGLVKQAQDLLRDALKQNPLHLQALRSLIATLSEEPDPKNSQEVADLIAAAKSAVEQKIAEASAGTQPAESLRRYQAIKSNIELLGIVADPNANTDEKNKQAEKLIKQGTDPFAVSVDLYRLYVTQPGREADALAQLKEAHRLKPDDQSVVELLFRRALASKDWALAEKMIAKATDLGMDRSGGRYYQGQLLYAKVDFGKSGVTAQGKEVLAQAERQFREAIERFPEHANAHAWLGRVLLVENRVEEAKEAFDKALKQNPRSAMGIWGMAHIADLQGDIETKVKYLDLCKELGISDEWVTQQLQLMEDARQPEQAIARREADRQKNPDDYANLLQLIQLYDRTHNNQKLREIYAETFRLQPKDLATLQQHVKFLRALDPPDMEGAEKLIRKSIESFGPDEKVDKATAQLLLAAHLEVMSLRKMPNAPSPEQIDAAFEEAALSDSGRNMIDIAAHFGRRGLLDKVEFWLRKAAAAAQREEDKITEMRARRELIQLVMGGRDYQRLADLKKEIDTYRARFPENPGGLLALSDYASLTGRETQALDYMNQYVAATHSADGYFNRGNINFRRSQWDLAIKDFREARNMAPDGFNYQHRIMLARCMENVGQVDQAMVELQSILKDSPGTLAAAQELHRIYMRRKQYDEAERLLLNYAQQSRNPATWLMELTQVALAREDAKRAVQFATEAAQKSQFDPRAVDGLLNTFMTLKQYDDLISFVNTQLPEAQRTEPYVLNRVGAALAYKQDKAKSADTFLQALQGSRDNLVVFMSTLANMGASLGRPEAIAAIDQRVAAAPDDAYLKFAQVALSREPGKEAEYIERAKQFLGTLPTDPKLLPLRLEAMRSITAAAWQAKDYATTRKYYEDILEHNPQDLVALNNLAYLLMENLNDPASAMKYAQGAWKIAPDQAGVLDTLGWNYVLLGNYDAGISSLRRALGLGYTLPPDATAPMHYHVAVALHRRALQAQKNQAGSDADTDLAEAKVECQRAYALQNYVGADPDGLIPKITELGKQLGLDLTASQPAAAAAGG